MNEDENEEMTWIQWFCSLPENHFLCEIDEDFIENDFNLYGLSTCVPHFDLVLENILQLEFSEEITPELMKEIEIESKKVYGLIHARYIVTLNGQQKMLKKYENEEFGNCNCIKCNKYPLLPLGTHDNYNIDTVKLYCPCCNDVYLVPKKNPARNLDGSFFGTTFPHLLLLQLDEKPKCSFNYIPRIFGFKLASSEYVRPTNYQQFMGRKNFLSYQSKK